MNQGRIRLKGIHRIEDRGQLLVLDLDELRGLLRNLLASGNHPGDGIADVPHAIEGEDVAILEVQADAGRCVLSRDHCPDASQRFGLAGINSLDQGMGVGTPYQPPVVQSRTELEVIYVSGGSGALVVRVHAGYALAYGVGRQSGHPTRLPSQRRPGQPR